MMKKVLKILLYYALIPLCASTAGFIIDFMGLTYLSLLIVPGLAAAAYIIFRKKMDMHLAMLVNVITSLMLLAIFTIMMLISSGNAEGPFMNNFCWFIIPFAPIILTKILVGQNMILFMTAILTYIVCSVVTAIFDRVSFRKAVLPVTLAVTCIAASTFLYTNRPAARYAGHGFEYMHGYSSTDFTDYMVYAKDSKLVSPDHEPPFMIELEEDMPVLDGAEACYPLYAAFAKALYLDIDVIEKDWLKQKDEQYCNGKIVTFTNSVVGFNRLLMDDPDGSGGEIDMFFGARPSSSQMKEAEELDVQLDIVPIGREAFVFFVEEDNPISDLTAEQVRAIYHGDIINWKELGGKDQEILAFQRPKNSGSQTMMEYFMGDVSLKEPKTFEKVDAMTGVIKEVAQYANEKGAMGYSFRYFLQELNQEKGVKMLSIDGIYPSLENIENGSYPLVTSVVLITRADETNPYVRKMTDFILSEEGQDIIRRTGYAGVAR